MRRAGFTLLEVVAALGLVAAVGVVASAAGQALAALSLAARAEASGLAAATEKLEEIMAMPREERSSGNDETTMASLVIARVWRVTQDQPAPELTRIEVTARWARPTLTLLTLVGVAP
jgi:prepilin-type N-terminal cleavage/methylation domain-containing protein